MFSVVALKKGSSSSMRFPYQLCQESADCPYRRISEKPVSRGLTCLSSHECHGTSVTLGLCSVSELREASNTFRNALTTLAPSHFHKNYILLPRLFCRNACLILSRVPLNIAIFWDCI